MKKNSFISMPLLQGFMLMRALCILLYIAAIVATDFPCDGVADVGLRKDEQLCRIGGSKLRFCSRFSLNGDGQFLPEGVSWMRAQYATSAVPGSAVQLFGVTLVLGISDGSQWSSGAFNVSFLDQLFGHDASQEFSKQAIFLQSQDIPSTLHKMPPPLFKDFIPPYSLHTALLFGSWHCVPILADGCWCSRWLSFLSASSKRGLIQSRHSSQLHTAEASYKLQAPDSSFTIYRSEVAEDVVAFCEVADASNPEFDSFQSLPGCLRPETEVVLQSLNRALVGGGSHRELRSKISLRVAGPDPIQEDCSLVLVEYLPNSIFADAFELQRLTKRGAIEEAYVAGDLNLEKPAFYSHQAIVEVQTSLFKAGSSLSAEVSLPLHVRYAPLSLAGSYSLVNLSFPQMLVKCSRRSSNPITKQVVWGDDTKEIDLSSSMVVHWPVPAGNISHAAFVTVWTTVTAVTGTMVLTVVAYMSSLKRPKTV